MSWLIFFAYLIFFCWLITRISFFKRAGLSKFVLCSLFVIKIIAGIAYFQFYSLPANKPTSDTWKFYNRSIPQTDILLKDPVDFAKDLFQTKHEATGQLFSDKNSYWNDVKDELMVKLMAVFNVFTIKNYYANIIWFNFLFFFGLIGFYRLIIEIYPRKSWPVVASLFLPSFLFWCSGIHKDGLIFSAIGLVLYSYHQLLASKKFIRNSLKVLFCLSLIFFLRNYIVFVLVPCLMTGYLLHLFPQRKGLILVMIILLGGVLMFTGKYIHPALNIPAYIADKQSQFKELKGGSAVQTTDLHPTFSSFAAALPSAIDMAFFRPHPTEKSISSKIAFAEVIVFWLVFIFCLSRIKSIFSQPPVILVCWLFAFITLLIIGYTVNFSGAVVRYRSLILPLLLTPAIAAYVQNKYIKKKYM